MSRMSPLPRLPYALLGMLTLACFGGPFGLLIVRGGQREGWPPDRPIEWIVIALVFTSAAALFVACVTLGWWYRWPKDDRGTPDPRAALAIESPDPEPGVVNSES